MVWCLSKILAVGLKAWGKNTRMVRMVTIITGAKVLNLLLYWNVVRIWRFEYFKQFWRKNCKILNLFWQSTMIRRRQDAVNWKFLESYIFVTINEWSLGWNRSQYLHVFAEKTSPSFCLNKGKFWNAILKGHTRKPNAVMVKCN